VTAKTRIVCGLRLSTNRLCHAAIDEK